MKKRILNTAIVVAMGMIAVSCGEARDPLGSVPDIHSGPILTQIPNPEGTEFIVFGGAALARTKSVSSATSQVETEEKINVIKPKLKVTKGKSSWKLEAGAPGFSEYSMDEEDEY